MKYDKINWKERFIEVLKDAVASDMMDAVLFDDEIEWTDEFYEKDHNMEHRYLVYDKVWDYVEEKFKEVFGEPLYEE